MILIITMPDVSAGTSPTEKKGNTNEKAKGPALFFTECVLELCQTPAVASFEARSDEKKSTYWF